MEKNRKNHRPIGHHPYLQSVSWSAIPITPWVIGVVCVRVFAALYMFIDPLWGFIASLIVDFFDWQVLKRVGFTAGMYQQIDKPIDWVGYAVEYILGCVAGHGLLFTVSMVHRAIGQYYYTKTNNRIWFLLFPNTIELFFLWYIVLPATGISNELLALHPEWLLYVVCIKVMQEILVHIITPRYYLWQIARGKITYHISKKK